jgi:hypothetical protein
VSLFSCGGGSGYNYRIRVWWSSSVFLLHVNLSPIFPVKFSLLLCLVGTSGVWLHGLGVLIIIGLGSGGVFFLAPGT